MQKKGISLIVLVITIIVMIILAASVVISLSNTGIIDKANTAVQLTDARQVQDLAGLVWAECYLDPAKKANLESSVKTELANQGITEDEWNITVTETGVAVTAKVNGNEEDEYGYLSGTWKFNDELTTVSDLTQNIEFTSNLNGNNAFELTGIKTETWLEFQLYYQLGDTSEWESVYGGIGGEGWSQTNQIITFTSKQQVSSEFYDWFVANAVKQ